MISSDLQITEVTVSLGATLNTLNYNSLRVDVTFKAQVPDGMTAEAATHALSVRVRDALLKELDGVDCNRTALEDFAAKAVS